MRHFDLAPLHRSTIGFDRLFTLLDQAAGHDREAQAYPPYNIERTGENDYRITIAVAGFGESELAIETAENALTVKGEKAPAADGAPSVLYQGIAGRGFQRRFHLADHVLVTGARLENGLLHVELTRELPEAMKPRVIPITTGEASRRANLKSIDAVPAAA
ncbi:MAG: Hsp20 family protein [Beijerinckiaceae bacterium]